jgi:hypothetical protein
LEKSLGDHSRRTLQRAYADYPVKGKPEPVYRATEVVIVGERPEGVSNPQDLARAEGVGHIEKGDVVQFLKGMVNGLASWIPGYDGPLQIDPRYAGAAETGKQLSTNLFMEAASAGLGAVISKAAGAATKLDGLNEFTRNFYASDGKLLNQQANQIYGSVRSQIGNPNFTIGVTTTFVEGKQYTVVTTSSPEAWQALRGHLPDGMELGPDPTPFLGSAAPKIKGYDPDLIGKLLPEHHVEIQGPAYLSDKYGAQAAIVGTSGPACDSCSQLWLSGQMPETLHTRVPQ